MLLVDANIILRYILGDHKELSLKSIVKRCQGEI